MVSYPRFPVIPIVPPSKRLASWLPDSIRSARGGPFFFYGVLLLMVGPLLIRRIHANDCWKALYSGRYLDGFHRFPHHSTFTFSPVVDTLPRDAYTWLGNLVLYWIHDLLGITGLQGLRVLVGVGALILVHSLFRYRVHSGVLVLLVFFLWGIGPKLQIRAALFAVPGVLLLLKIWSLAVYRDRPGWLYALPPVLVVWSNLHGSYRVGVVSLILLVAGEGLKLLPGFPRRDRRRFYRLLAVLALTLVLTVLLKPFPDDGLPRQVADTVKRVSRLASPGVVPDPGEASDRTRGTDSLRGVRSFYRHFLFPQRPFRSREFAFPLDNLQYLFVGVSLLSGLLAGLYLAGSGRFRQYDLLLLYLGITLLGLGYLRTVSYLPMVGVPLIGIGSQSGNGGSDGPSWVGRGVVILLLLGGINSGLRGGLSGITGQPHHEMGLGVAPKFRSSLPEFVLGSHPRARTFNSYNLGSYLVWVWWPRKKVFVDTKSSAYRNEFWREFARHGLRSTLEKAGVALALVQGTSPVNRGFFARDRGWARVQGEGSMVLYRRRSTLGLGRGTPHPGYPRAMVSVERRSSSVIGLMR